MRITNIELRYDPKNPDNKWIYADLVNTQGELMISSTLEDILQKAVDRNYKIVNVGRYNGTTRKSFAAKLKGRFFSSQSGQSLIGVLVAVGIASILSLAVVSITTQMIKTNTNAAATSEMLEYVNELRSALQQITPSSTSLNTQSFVEQTVVLKDPLTNAVLAGPNFQQTPQSVWKINYLQFTNVVAVPSQNNLYRATLVASFQLDSKRIIGPSALPLKTIGNVFCIANSGIIQMCYGSTDIVTIAQTNCLSLSGSWDVSKPFGSQCTLPLAANSARFKTLSFDAVPLVCENFPVSVSCPAPRKIVILESSYGANCGVGNNYGLSTVQGLCNGMADCAFTAGNNNNCNNQGVFVDPSVGCAKSYHMSYYCS